MIEPRGCEIANGDDSVWRQVNPKFLHQGHLSTQVFRPGGEDAKLVSTHWSARATAAEAYAVHTEIKLKPSAGVLKLTVADASNLGSKVFHDPEDEPIADQAHAVIDFRDCETRKIVEKRAKKMLDAAAKYGWQHPPERVVVQIMTT